MISGRITESGLDDIKVRTPRAGGALSCRECGCTFRAQRASAEFCSSKCRSIFHNRAASRGADLFHFFMSIRFDRAAAQKAGAWSLMCRLAASYRAEDFQERDGRKSWVNIEQTKARNGRLTSTVLSVNAAGSAARKLGTIE
jgi:hypothetical protein